jgi:hypothetical protein
MPEQDNDLLADLLDGEIEAEDNTPAASTDELDALKTQVEELENANAGLLKAKQAAVRKRQDGDDRLAQLEGAVSGILSQRQQQGVESLTEAQVADARKQGIPVSYDEDGNGWIDQSLIDSMLTPYQQQITDLEAKLQRSDQTNSNVANANKVMEGIIGEDERYGPASGRYRAARKWVEEKVEDFSSANGVTRALTSGEALDHVFDAFTQSEFKKQFEGINLLDIVTAEDSEQHFRRALTGIADASATADALFAPKEKMESRFQKVLDKPSALGNQTNAKAGQLSVLERVGSLKTSDIMDLSDAQIDALMKLSEKE